MKEERLKKKLTVTDYVEVTSWSNPKGSDTVLYGVKAVDEDGKPWEPLPLRSFAQLEIGVQFEYDIERYKHKDTGDESLTLKRPRQNTSQRVTYMEKQLEDVFDRLAAVEEQLAQRPSAPVRPLGDPLPGQRPPGLGGRVG